jgi:tetratricopeptide (TPR) repeat protein
MSPGERIGLARYLRPEEQVVPFRSRPELDELVRWCAQGGRVGVRLVTGDGGSGKTRLALRLGEVLAAGGWQQLWVLHGSEREAVRDVREVGQPCVLVVDYAETCSDLAGLADDLAATGIGPDVRVVLLARSAGEWWQQLLAGTGERAAALLDAAAPITLGTVRATGGPQEVFDEALAVFARQLGVACPHVQLTLTDPDPVVLVVHAAALLAVMDNAAGASPERQAWSGPQVLERLLAHEARYWARSTAGRGLHLDISVLRLAVALGSLIGADSESTAAELLAVVPDLDSAERRGQVARWLHDLYPTAHEYGADKREWLGPLRPDRLAEQLVAGELARRPELIPRVFAGLDEFRAAKALTVLARAALTQERAVALLSSALVADLDHLAIPALSVAVTTNPVVGDLLSEACQTQPVSRDTLARVAGAAPYPSLALAAPTAVILRQLADGSAADNERVRWLMDLSNCLASLGRREEALAAIEEAAGIYRLLAAARPQAFLPDLAASLNNLSVRLADLGRLEEALAAIEEAVTIYRQLAAVRPEAVLPDLAMPLNNLANRLADLGRLEEALAAIEEAVTIYRQLADDRQGTVFPDLAMSLHTLANRLGDLGRREEALAAIEEAVTIRRLLANDRPDAFLPDLATSLNNQSLHLADLGRPEDALAAIEEAARIYQQLAAARPQAFLPDLAMSLNNQSLRLADLGRLEEALTANEEAVTIRRQLADDRPDAFLPDLAMSLNNQSADLADLGRLEEALAASQEAVTIRRQLANDRPGVFLPDLATSLNNRSLRLADLGRLEEALAASQEAVTIRRQLANDRPAVFLPKLAMSLGNLAWTFKMLGREPEALRALAEVDAIHTSRPGA